MSNFKLLHKLIVGFGIKLRLYSDKPRLNSLRIDNMNQNIVAMEYAVRGPIMVRAGEIEHELKSGAKKPFKHVLKANLGDCHAMGQEPITFIRQCLALTMYPKLLDNPDFPEDAKKRACAILEACRGQSIGSYSESPGIEMIRKQVACYIQKRDCGVPCDWNNVVICSGASDGIKNLMKLLINHEDGKKPGILTPIPQYPLYSATIVQFGMELISYYLDEDNNWALDMCEMQNTIDEAREKGIHPRAIVVINPGNPTGQVLERENIEEIIKFAYKERLFIFADEVYQFNVYAEGSEFHSIKKVMFEMGKPYCEMELASFMSCSKGYLGECGLRGGYLELINICSDVRAMYLKSISAMLCPSIIGQSCVYVMCNPPEEDEPSYEQFEEEKNDVLETLKERAELVHDTLNKIEGVKCNVVQGAMYAFPRLEIPKKAIEAAKKAKQQPDTFYAFQLLESTGICIVAGSGFGQKPGTFHYRTTILPQTDLLIEMLNQLKKFHMDFLAKYK